MSVNNKAETDTPTDTARLISNRTSLLWFASISAVFAGARLWRLTESCLWFDEIFSVHAARHSWSNLFYFVAADIIHPPLFYVLLKIWISLGGESLRWLRLLPAFICIASIGPFALLCREIKMKWSEISLALLLLAVNGYLIKYAQEVRMYSLLFFFSICSLWLFFKLFNRDNATRALFILLGLINLLLVYTHYAGWIVVFLEAGILLAWQRRKLLGFLLTVALLVLAYAPWIYIVFRVGRSAAAGRGVAENIGWVTKPGILDLVQYFVLLNRPFLFIQSSTQTGYSLVMAVVAAVLFGFPLAAFLWNSLNERKTKNRNAVVYALAVFLLGPSVIAFLLSWVFPYSVWGTRHLIIASAPYAILVAIALKHLSPIWLRFTTLAVIGCWFLLSALVFVSSPQPSFIWCTWESLGQQAVASQSSSPVSLNLYAYEDLVAYHLWFALASEENQKVRVRVIKEVPGLQEDPAYFLPRAFSEIPVQRNHQLSVDNNWIAFRANQWDETRPPINVVRNSGFTIGQVLSMKAQGQQAFLVQLVRSSK